MKNVFFALAASLALTAAPALAQLAPAPQPPGPVMRAQFKRMHAHMEQIHRAERSRILAALTPAHKALFAQIVGQLAVAAAPNPKAAAAQLDAALSSAEKQAIVNSAKSAHRQMHAQMEAMHKAFMAGHAPGHRLVRVRTAHTPDPGRILLHVAMPGAEMHLLVMRRR